MDRVELEVKPMVKYLEVYLLFTRHIENVKRKAYELMTILCSLLENNGMLKKNKRTIYLTMIRPLFIYGCEV